MLRVRAVHMVGFRVRLRIRLRLRARLKIRVYGLG